MRFAALLGLGMYALMAFALIEELKDDWKKLKYVLKTLKNDGDNDDTCECEEHDDTYKDDAYEYDDEYDDEELKQKNIKERVWEIFANVLLKIPTKGVWGSITKVIFGLIGLIGFTLIGACL